jgi:hypothetical protein
MCEQKFSLISICGVGHCWSYKKKQWVLSQSRGYRSVVYAMVARCTKEANGVFEHFLSQGSRTVLKAMVG